MAKQIILASGSETRRIMLEKAGVKFEVIKPDVDEEELKTKLVNLSMKDLGLSLAIAKAQSVSAKYPEAYTIAADQICELDGVIFDKPGSADNCIKHLSLLRGKTHLQHCCACVYRGDRLIAEIYQVAKLKMRQLSDQEIADYVELEKPYHSCGSYMFERNGHALFKKIEGEAETILGLPLEKILSLIG